MLRLQQGDYGSYLIEQVFIDGIELHESRQDYMQAEIKPTGRTLPVQTDWDYPAIAMNFGWEPCPFCRETDGTVDGKHRNPSAMIQSAQNFLDKQIGNITEDPGYFP